MGTDLVEALETLLDKLAGEPITGVAQRDAVTRLDRCRSRLDAELARRLVEMDRRAEHTVVGHKTLAGFLVGRTRCTRPDAYRRVRVARQVAALPATAKAWATGKISTTHVELIAKARHTARADEHFARYEPALLRVARAGQPEDVAACAAAWRDALDNDLGRDGSDTRAGEQYEVRAATYARSIDQLGFLAATFDPEGASIADRAITRAYQRGHRQADPRTPPQQRADAIIEIFNAYLAGLPRTGNLPHLLVITDQATLTGDAVGRAHTADGTRLSPDAIRRIACTAFIQQVLVGDDGVPLAMGRASRLFTPHQYRAMVIRDGHCRGPHCHAPPDQCEPHHLDEWVADDGPTDLTNGALFCRHGCHRNLHEGKITVTGDANSRLDFHDKHGNHLGSSQPQTPREAIPTNKRRERAHAITEMAAGLRV